MSSLNDEIKKQEEDIFGELGNYDFQNELPFHKNKARQQLAISADSPFSNAGAENAEAQWKRIKEERAALLRDETNEIRRQLDLVKSRLNDLRSPKATRPESESEANEKQDGSIEPPKCKQKSAQRPTPAAKIKSHPEAKLRPLTGKADCPNCACDRRSSVCNQCISMSTINQRPRSGSNKKISSPPRDQPTWFTYEDERPIRPAKDRTLATVEVVDDKVVPGRVYTISKSLNEKRTKLAQAIGDLESMMEQVKDKGDKLDKERKLVQLYKDQWKYGPSIGGPSASSRERLGLAQQNRNYESRLDPNLSRDTKSLTGYNHIEPGLKLRQYGPPRRTNPKQVVHSRSKSLESLKPAPNANSQKALAKFNTGKSSSEVDLSTTTLKAVIEEPRDRNEIEEIDELQVEESVGVQSIQCSPEGSVVENNNNNNNSSMTKSETKLAEDNGGDTRVQRMSWIPVFGETEIKTIKRDAKQRKVQAFKSNNIPKPNQTSDKPPTTGKARHIVIHSSSNRSKSNLDNESSANLSKEKVSNKNSAGNKVITEAARKLRFASNLLEQEQKDSMTKNQLIVNKSKPVPAPRKSSRAQTINAQETDLNESINSTNAKEISRLEEMVNEQQRLLLRLIQSQDRYNASPTLFRHSCHQMCASDSSSAHRTKSSHRVLIATLRERLNKTKTRLARTLEAERERHQQLKLKVDSSIRKQTNLETENELLKQSLSKCIDTCLKDISNTFESLSDTLNDSICKQSEDDDDTRSADGGGGGDGGSAASLSNAAQLIADNRHLQQMKSHIETIERQRKRIFEELSREKQRSNQLESQLKESQSELNELMTTKHGLETRLTQNKNTETDEQTASSLPLSNGHKTPTTTAATTCQPSTSKQTPLDDTTTTETTDLDDTLNSVDVYRRYIQSMSPDIESIRRERKMILSEFDNIKKMLSDIDS